MKLLLVSLILFLCFYLTHEEIHRARGIKPPKLGIRKFTPRSTWPPGPNVDDITVEQIGREDEDIEGVITRHEKIGGSHSKEAWIYSIVSSALVGLSGIFPLLVIPLESGEALKHGAPAARLKLLLSFAVGGLLGDVFLHLLPEAWQSLQVDDHRSHTKVGLWIMFGMLVFLIIEKMFPDEEENTGAQEQTVTDEVITYHENTIHEQDSQNLRHRKATVTESGQTLDENVLVSNGDVMSTNKYTEQNGRLEDQNGVCWRTSDSKSAEHHIEKSHIKISGWLNLMANVVDNFTHGLAVAGSYCVSTKVGILTTFAILLHEIPHEVGDFAILLRAGFDRWKAARAQILTASGGMIGALCALTANSVQEAGDMTAWILPFTAGGFIYIALVTCVPDLLTEKDPWESIKQVVLLCCGIAVMALVTLMG